MDDLLEQFLIEGRELVEQASNNLVALERNANRMPIAWIVCSGPFTRSKVL